MQDWNTRIDKVTEEIRQMVSGISEEQFNQRTSPQTWSIAQNIQHLIRLNQSYFPDFRALQAGTYKRPLISNLGFLTRFFGKLILKSVNPGRKKRVKTFSIWEPDDGPFALDLIQDFVEHQQVLKQHIADCQNDINGGATISSPANRNIVYTLKDAFEIIVTHEERHARQMEEALAAMIQTT